MSHKVTAQEAAGRFPELLERVHRDHATFVILVDGEEVAQLSPVPAAQPVATLGSFFELLRNNRPDAGYFKDLEKIHDERALRRTAFASQETVKVEGL